MHVLIFGKGGISGGITAAIDHDVTELSHNEADVRCRVAVARAIKSLAPDWIINCAGVSDHTNPFYEVQTNLMGTIYVAQAAGQIPSIHIASVAGLYGKPDHVGYSASKAGVISVVQSLGFSQPIWAISPGRVDTPMRERDYPDDTPGSRLHPEQIGWVVTDIMANKYERGSNVIIRKVGLDTIVVTEHRGDGWRERLHVGRPKTI
jgi:NAD(P)-dependent dehydrogenase (short-subunit alcohol dehydrogenase family)